MSDTKTALELLMSAGQEAWEQYGGQWEACSDCAFYHFVDDVHGMLIGECTADRVQQCQQLWEDARDYLLSLQQISLPK